MDEKSFDLFLRRQFKEYEDHLQPRTSTYQKSYIDSDFSKKDGCALFSADRFFAQTESICFNFHFNLPIALIPHYHDFFEIIYVYRGQVNHHIGKSDFTLSEGDICITNPNTKHQLSKIEEGTLVVNLLIKREILSSIFVLLSRSENVLFQFFSNCLYGYDNLTHILYRKEDYGSSDLLVFLHRMMQEYFQKKPEYQKAIEYHLHLFCLELTRIYIEQHTSNKDLSETNANIEQILQYITENFRTVTLESVANEFHYHPTYLPQLLKKHTGRNFMEILQTVRISIAKEKLRTSSLTIEEVSEFAGYNNKTHFYRIFKKLVGISPLQYRKKSVNL